VSSTGRWKPRGFIPKSLAETPRSNSNARMRVKSRALVLFIRKEEKILESDVDGHHGNEERKI
jgi:hypothetical protein